MATDEERKADPGAVPEGGEYLDLFPDEEGPALQLPSRDDDPDVDDQDGLAIDDHQAKEIREIFLTSLPQYLEPVQEMVEQLFSDSGGGQFEALTATLSSLATAAARIGFDDIRGLLERMQIRLSGGSPEREELLADLQRIRDIAGAGGASSSPRTGERLETVVSALREIGGFEESVLRQLTTAGLVTVDQLLAAKPDEIVAVSGLTATVVDQLLAALRNRATRARGAENVIKLELTSDSLSQQLDAKHQSQVKAEASVIELRAEVQRLRSRIAERRQELAGLETRKDEIQTGISQESDRIGRLTSALRQARTVQKDLAQRRQEMEEELLRKEHRVLELGAECLAAAEEKEKFDQEVRALVGRVQLLLQNTHL